MLVLHDALDIVVDVLLVGRIIIRIKLHVNLNLELLMLNRPIADIHLLVVATLHHKILIIFIPLEGVVGSLDLLSLLLGPEHLANHLESVCEVILILKIGISFPSGDQMLVVVEAELSKQVAILLMKVALRENADNGFIEALVFLWANILIGESLNLVLEEHKIRVLTLLHDLHQLLILLLKLMSQELLPLLTASIDHAKQQLLELLVLVFLSIDNNGALSKLLQLTHELIDGLLHDSCLYDLDILLIFSLI